MKKCSLLCLIAVIIPGFCFGESARYTALVREKQQKMEELEKCMGKQKGLKIAGISTLGLTTVGVAGNIAEAKIRKSNEQTIEKQESKIESLQSEIDGKKAKIAEKEASERAQQQQWNNTHKLSDVYNSDIDTISKLGGNIGDIAVTHGYDPEQIQTVYGGGIKDSVLKFIGNCEKLQGQNNIKTVSFGSKTKSEWQSFSSNGTLKLDSILSDENEHEIARCEISECVETYKKSDDGKECVEAGTTLKPVVIKQCQKNVLESLNATAGTEQEDTCYVQNCKDGYHLESNGKTYTVDEYYNMPSFDKDMKCVKDYASQLEMPKYIGTVPGLGQPAEMNLKGTVQGIDIKPDQLPIDNATKTDAPKAQTPKTTTKKTETTKKTDTNESAGTTTKQWTDAEKKKNPNEYCSKYFLKGQTLKSGESAYGCCQSIVAGRASSYNEKSQTCDCKPGTKWRSNFCETTTEKISYFENIKVNLNQGKKLVEMWAKNKGLSINTSKCNKNSEGHDIWDDWLKCDLGVGYYEFKFDSLTSSGGNTYGVGEALCELRGGTFESNGSSKIIKCTGIDCESWKKAVKSVGAPAETSEKYSFCHLKY